MTPNDTSSDASELLAGSATSLAPQQKRRAWQFGLRTLFLFVAATAVWITFLVNHGQIEMLKTRIAAMRPMAHELVIADPDRIAVVRREELWFDENQWDVHLPPGR